MSGTQIHPAPSSRISKIPHIASSAKFLAR